MELVKSLGIILGSSYTSGLSTYLTIASLGIAQKIRWVHLPGQMNLLSHPLVILIAVVLYGIEFFADKIPYVD